MNSSILLMAIASITSIVVAYYALKTTPKAH